MRPPLHTPLHTAYNSDKQLKYAAHSGSLYNTVTSTALPWAYAVCAVSKTCTIQTVLWTCIRDPVGITIYVSYIRLWQSHGANRSVNRLYGRV